jgi:hypothetical protein
VLTINSLKVEKKLNVSRNTGNKLHKARVERERKRFSFESGTSFFICMSASKQQRGNRRRTCHKRSVGLIDIPLVSIVAEFQNLIKSLKSTPIMAQKTRSSHRLFWKSPRWQIKYDSCESEWLLWNFRYQRSARGGDCEMRQPPSLCFAPLGGTLSRKVPQPQRGGN